MAQHSLRLSRWDEAEAALDRVLALNPDHPVAPHTKRYLPKLRAAKTDAERLRLRLSMARDLSEATSELLDDIEIPEEVDARQADRRASLRKRLGLTDEALRKQPSSDPIRLMRLSDALKALEDDAAREAYLRKILAAEPDRVKVMVELVDALIGQGCYADARREAAGFRQRFPDDLELRLYESYLKQLVGLSTEQARPVVMDLLFDRATLEMMIMEAQLGGGETPKP